MFSAKAYAYRNHHTAVRSILPLCTASSLSVYERWCSFKSMGSILKVIFPPQVHLCRIESSAMRDSQLKISAF